MTFVPVPSDTSHVALWFIDISTENKVATPGDGSGDASGEGHVQLSASDPPTRLRIDANLRRTVIPRGGAWCCARGADIAVVAKIPT